MKIIHIFPFEKFTQPFIKFLNKNFNDREHIFIIYYKNSIYYDEEISKNKNVIVVKNKFQLLKYISKYSFKADKIIFHSLFITNIILLFICLFPSLLKKTNWIIWGGDLYSNLNDKNKRNIGVKVRNKFITNIGEIGYLVKKDYNLVREFYKTKAKAKLAVYLLPTNIQLLKKYEEINIKDSKTFNIQIGNSATESNNHKEIIDMLEKYRLENIQVFIPLSYGDEKYANEISKYAFEKLGEKAIPMLELMTPDQYAKYLNKIDIAIFNNNRQQALGNIFAISYLKGKIYMKSDTTMWEDLVCDQGYKFNDVKEIKYMSYHEFILKNKNNTENNRKLSLFRFDEYAIAHVWEKIFV